VSSFLASHGALVRARTAVRRGLRAATPGVRVALLILEEFQLFGRDSVSVLRMLFDHGLPARARMLRPRIVRPGMRRPGMGWPGMRRPGNPLRVPASPRLPIAVAGLPGTLRFGTRALRSPPPGLPRGLLRSGPTLRAGGGVALLAAPNRRRPLGPIRAERTRRGDAPLGIRVRPRGPPGGTLGRLHRKA
jgi:hypothetical protein